MLNLLIMYYIIKQPKIKEYLYYSGGILLTVIRMRMVQDIYYINYVKLLSYSVGDTRRYKHTIIS